MIRKHTGLAEKICHYCKKQIKGKSVKSGDKFFCSELCHVAHLKHLPKPKKAPPKTACRFC